MKTAEKHQQAHLGTPSCTRDNRPPAPEPSLHPGGQNREWKHVKDVTGITRVYETYVSWDGRMLTEEQTLDWDPGIIECGCTAKLKVLRYVKRQEWKKYVRWIWILLISTASTKSIISCDITCVTSNGRAFLWFVAADRTEMSPSHLLK